MTKHTQLFFGLARIGLGWIFLWAFIDKVFGLGFATAAGKAWIDGVSPTYGYLAFATKGPLAEIFQMLAGNVLVDVLFMAGLLFIGLSLMLGIMVKLGGYAGTAMLLLMFISGSLLPEHNPLIDEHIIHALVLLGLTTIPAGEWIGLGKEWKKLPLVRKNPILQ